MADLPEPPSLYGYTPTTSVCLTFIVLFSVSALIHGCEAVHWKLWWFLGLACTSAGLEVIGWLGRLWSSFAPAHLMPYIIQTVATVIAPTPLLAANFLILGMLIRYLGEQYSRLSAKLYSIVFTSADVVALMIQAFGGAKASAAVNNNTDPEPGAHVMLIGIVIQMIAITFYVILASEFFIRFQLNKPVRMKSYVHLDIEKKTLGRNIKLMVAGLGFSTVVIFIRTVYRTIELVNGFTGIIIRTQIYFNVLDGAMIVLASYCLNFFHPGYLLADVIASERKANSIDKMRKKGLPVSQVSGGEWKYSGDEYKYDTSSDYPLKDMRGSWIKVEEWKDNEHA